MKTIPTFTTAIGSYIGSEWIVFIRGCSTLYIHFLGGFIIQGPIAVVIATIVGEHACYAQFTQGHHVRTMLVQWNVLSIQFPVSHQGFIYCGRYVTKIMIHVAQGHLETLGPSSETSLEPGELGLYSDMMHNKFVFKNTCALALVEYTVHTVEIQF